MPSTLLDRPATPGQPPRGSRRSPAVVAGALAAAAALGLVGWRGLDLLPGLPDPVQEVDRSTPALLTALDDLEEYHAATGDFQVVVDLEKDTRWVPSALSGERTTYLATGSVDAIVDFADLGPAAVTTDGPSVRFSLPPARLGEADVDLDSSRVVSRDRGVLDRLGGVFRDSPTSEREVAALAEDKLDAAAAESDLRQRAEENTRRMLTQLATSLGYTDVTVEFDAADGL